MIVYTIICNIYVRNFHTCSNVFVYFMCALYIILMVNSIHVRNFRHFGRDENLLTKNSQITVNVRSIIFLYTIAVALCTLAAEIIARSSKCYSCQTAFCIH